MSGKIDGVALDEQKQAQVDAARAVFGQLMKGFKNIALYRHSVSRYGEFLERAYDALAGYLETYQSLPVKVEAEAFTLHKQSLLPTDSDDKLPYKFHKDGIRNLIFRQGVTSEEFLKFALITMTNYDDAEHRGNDILSDLWAANLEHIEHLVVEGFSFADLSEEDVQVEVDKIVAYLYHRLQSHSDDFLRFARLSADDLNIKMDGVDQVRGVVIQGQPVSEKLAQAIQADLRDDEGSRLLPKLMSVIFSLLDDDPNPRGFQDIFAQLLDAMLLQEDFQTINQLLVKLRALERIEARADVAAELTPLRDCEDGRGGAAEPDHRDPPRRPPQAAAGRPALPERAAGRGGNPAPGGARHGGAPAEPAAALRRAGGARQPDA